jgi:tRNA 2-selenouridine synthase
VAAIELLQAVDTAGLAAFDAVIDVRSPGEFAHDHAPGAVNLPVLSNAERAQVGTIYVQESHFRARRLGAALIARNVATHLETAMADWSGSFRPLVYCWRGGQRSNAMATILSQVGWRTTVLAGGYKTWRRHVVTRLYDEAQLPQRFILVAGGTGCGKTELLGLLAKRGAQTLDLEALAAHRGSLFGALPGRPQPSQKLFESRLLAALERLDPAYPVIAEAESSKVGERMLPPALWQAMSAAPHIELTVPPRERARYLVRAYPDIAADPQGLEQRLHRLPTPPGRKRLTEWRALAEAGEMEALAAALIVNHYDPAYNRAARARAVPALGVIDVPSLDAAGLSAAADQVLALTGKELSPAST